MKEQKPKTNAWRNGYSEGRKMNFCENMRKVEQARADERAKMFLALEKMIKEHGERDCNCYFNGCFEKFKKKLEQKT